MHDRRAPSCSRCLRRNRTTTRQYSPVRPGRQRPLPRPGVRNRGPSPCLYPDLHCDRRLEAQKTDCSEGNRGPVTRVVHDRLLENTQRVGGLESASHTDQAAAAREPRLRRVPRGHAAQVERAWKVARRTIVLDANVLLNKNLSVLPEGQTNQLDVSRPLIRRRHCAICLCSSAQMGEAVPQPPVTGECRLRP